MATVMRFLPGSRLGFGGETGSGGSERKHKPCQRARASRKSDFKLDHYQNFWSLLKRAIKGTYVSVEPFHLFRYLDEQAFRFNERIGSDAERFALALAGIINKRLTYKALTGADMVETC
jgi:hypothetical protein